MWPQQTQPTSKILGSYIHRWTRNHVHRIWSPYWNRLQSDTIAVQFDTRLKSIWFIKRTKSSLNWMIIKWKWNANTRFCHFQISGKTPSTRHVCISRSEHLCKGYLLTGSVILFSSLDPVPSGRTEKRQELGLWCGKSPLMIPSHTSLGTLAR